MRFACIALELNYKRAFASGYLLNRAAIIKKCVEMDAYVLKGQVAIER